MTRSQDDTVTFTETIGRFTCLSVLELHGRDVGTMHTISRGSTTHAAVPTSTRLSGSGVLQCGAQDLL